MAIHFFNEEVSLKLFHLSRLKSWVKATCTKECKDLGEINFIFCSDDYLLKLNHEFLKHSTYTDIITFDYSDIESVSGDIFISIDRVYENAKKFKVPLDQELLRVVIHGILHLIGYSDKSKSKKFIMRKKEDEYLSLWNETIVPRGTKKRTLSVVSRGTKSTK